MRYNTYDLTVNMNCKISYARIVREATFETLASFRFQLEKNAAKAKEIICSVLGENVVLQYI